MRVSCFSWTLGCGAAALALVVAAGSEVRSAPGETPAQALAEFGQVFPAGIYPNLNAGAGGAPKIDLKDLIGKRPIVLCYWIPDHVRSEDTLKEAQAIADEAGPSKLVLFGVATPPVGSSPATDADWVRKAKDRIAALKIHIPVLEDEGFKIGRLIGVRSVPSLSVLDGEGRLRMANAGSLKQPLEYNLDVAAALRRVAGSGQLGTYGSLPTYYPATEMVGRKCPDFEAPIVGGGAPKKSSSLLAPDKVNVLIFWAQDCPHCRKSLPEINAYVKAHPAGINVLTAAKVLNDAGRTQTEEFCKQKGFVFPTVLDQDLSVGQQFMVTSTPTVFIIRPDGVIDSVLFSGETDYAPIFETKKRQLLKS